MGCVSAAPHRGFARPDTIRPPTISTPPLELADLIVRALPASDDVTPGWDYLADGPVTWPHASYEADSQGNMVRIGLARVRVDGRIARKLGRKPVELPWTVLLQGSPNPSRGVFAVHIRPGSTDQPCTGHVADCLFQADDVFSATSVQHQRICFAGAKDANQSVYAVSAPGRREGYAVFTRSFGADGTSMRIDLSWNGTAPDCRNPTG